MASIKQDKQLRLLEGLHTAETAAVTLHISRQAALNLLSRLKKEGHVTTRGGGRRKRLYTITMIKQRQRDPGMFDIINKYSPAMKLAPWFDHQVHGPYGAEEALIDALGTRSFRVILTSLRLFSHITDWSKLYRLAKEKDCWQKVGALYDIARMFFRVRKMPERYHPIKKTKKYTVVTSVFETKEERFKRIEKRWNVPIPFLKGDIEKVMYG